jgi:dTDP-4-amino-4,6-dideoxygalactose transaminase
LKIPFNIPYTTGKEIENIREAIASGHVSGNGPFTKKCHKLLKEKGYGKVLLTTSCTDALEMAAILLDIKPGDEVIVPAFTFVSTALAFERQGARLVFADSRRDNPCMDEKKLEPLITEKTKAIVPVHYGGIICEMDIIMKLANQYNLRVVEDAAHAFGTSYKGKLLGTTGDIGCFSFHETKVIHCGEGGMISVNNPEFYKRVEIIWEKGTNRCEFQRGEVTSYEWKDTGSSFLLSDLNAAFLFNQINAAQKIIERRRKQWELYHDLLEKNEARHFFSTPSLMDGLDYNYYSFYLITRSGQERNDLKDYLSLSGIQAVTHYFDLGASHYMKEKGMSVPPGINKNSYRYQETLLRLPLFHDLKMESIRFIADRIRSFYESPGSSE